MLRRAFLLVMVLGLGLVLPLSGSLKSWMQPGWAGGEGGPKRLSSSKMARATTISRVEPLPPVRWEVQISPTPAVEVPAAPASSRVELRFVTEKLSPENAIETIETSLVIEADHALAALVDWVAESTGLVRGGVGTLTAGLGEIPPAVGRAARDRTHEEATFAGLVEAFARESADELAASSAEAPTPEVAAEEADPDRAFLLAMEQSVELFAPELVLVPEAIAASASFPSEDDEDAEFGRLVEATVQDFVEGRDPEVLASTVGAQAPGEEVAFTAVVDEMVASFTADLVAESAIMVLVETSVDPGAVQSSTATDDPASASDEDGRARGLSEAVRLTNQAVSAWMELMHARTIVSLVP